MAACYSSSAAAPLHGLANAMLGESSFAAKSSTFSPAPTKSAPNSLHSHHQQPQHVPPHLRHGNHHHHHRLHPLSPVIRSHPPSIPAPRPHDPFEQAWSQHSHQHHPTPADLVDPSEGYHQFSQVHHHHHHHHQPLPYHLSLHTAPSPTTLPLHPLQNGFDQAWQHAAAVSETATITPAAHVQTAAQRQTNKVQSAPPVATLADGDSTLFADFEGFVYQPESLPTTLQVPGGDHTLQEDGTTSLEQAWTASSLAPATDASSSWAQEMQQQQQDSDSEDEFSQEWSNEAFTTAYIAANKAQFDKLQARDDERERRRLENQERENQLRRSGTIHPATITNHPTNCTCTGQASHAATRGGGPADQDEQHLLLYNEFMRFNKTPNSASLFNNDHPHLAHPPHHHHLICQQDQIPTWASEFTIGSMGATTTTTTTTTTGAAAAAIMATAPVRHVDGFEAMTTDLDEAALLYHPAAKSKADQHNPINDQETVQPPDCDNSDPWAREFASSMGSADTNSSCQPQRVPTWHRYLGEWDWQAMFGKVTTPQQQHGGSKLNSINASGELRHSKDPEEQSLEHQRLQAVALSRLAALFGHLSVQPGDNC